MTTPPPPSPDPVTRLAARMAHELNNPLDAVLRFVSLAQRKLKSHDYADIHRHLNDAQFGLERMTEILRELMDIGRQTQSIVSQPPLPIADLITHALRTTSALAEQKSISMVLTNRLAPTLTAPKYDLRVSQVIANLLKNAIEASPDRSSILLTFSASASAITLTIEDSGPGLDPSFSPHLFSPFVTTKPHGAGHGLGLSISRDLLTPLGGSLTLDNRPAPSTGCIAALSLPL